MQQVSSLRLECRFHIDSSNNNTINISTIIYKQSTINIVIQYLSYSVITSHPKSHTKLQAVLMSLTAYCYPRKPWNATQSCYSTNKVILSNCSAVVHSHSDTNRHITLSFCVLGVYHTISRLSISWQFSPLCTSASSWLLSIYNLS